MDLIERVESYKVLFKECKALEPVSTALAKGYKSATPLQRLEIIRELDTELADVYSVEIPVITAWVRDDNYVHSTKEIFLGEPSLEGFLHQFRHHLQNKAREPQYKYLLVENMILRRITGSLIRIVCIGCMGRMMPERGLGWLLS